MTNSPNFKGMTNLIFWWHYYCIQKIKNVKFFTVFFFDFLGNFNIDVLEMFYHEDKHRFILIQKNEKEGIYG